MLRAEFQDVPFKAEESSADLSPELVDRLMDVLPAFLPDIKKEDLGSILDSAAEGSGLGFCWTLDPGDGTQGFLRSEQYAVALALLENNVPVVGVLGCPGSPHLTRSTAALAAGQQQGPR